MSWALSSAPWAPHGDMGFSVYPWRLPFGVFFPAAALSTVHMPPQLRSSFQDRAANSVGELRRGVQGHAYSHQSLHPCSSNLRNPSWKRKWAGEQQAAGPVSWQGVHVAERPAGGTGGDRCHGGPDLFLQEECKELIVSLPRSGLSTALPCLVERIYRFMHVRVGGRLQEGSGRLSWV